MPTTTTRPRCSSLGSVYFEKSSDVTSEDFSALIGLVILTNRQSFYQFLASMFEELIKLENIFSAWREFRSGKNNRLDIITFERNLEDNLFALHEELVTHTYKHGPYHVFHVWDPKHRIINKATVRDRVVHHLVFRELYRIFNPTFIFHSYSSRLGKGAHRAVKNLSNILRSASHNYTKPTFALKCDIKQFFASVPHQKLLQIIKRKIKDSQFIKHTLKVKHYFRYADDFVLLNDSQNILQQQPTQFDIFAHPCYIIAYSAPVFGLRSMRPKRGKTAKINQNLIMQNYELLFVLPGTLSDEETAPTVEKVKGKIEKNNGIEYSLEAMDKKRLAYPIKHIRYGYFYLAFFKAEPKDAVQMQKELKVMPEFLRALLQKYNPKKQTMRKIDFGEMFQSAPAYSERVEPAVYNAPTQSTVVSTPAEAEVAAPQSAPTEQVAIQAPISAPIKKAESKKISLEEIDKKLDEILDIDLGSV